MKLTSELTLPIVERLLQIVNYNINIMDKHGMIVASGDVNRINHHHEGAMNVLSNRKEFIVNDSEFERWEGTKPGVNLPIEFYDDIIGVVGITGNPDKVYKFAEC